MIELIIKKEEEPRFYIIKKGITYTTIDIGFNNKIIDLSAISIELQGKKLILVSIYVRKGRQDEFIAELTNIFNKLNLTSPNNLYVIIGDFNAKQEWNNANNNSRGITLNNWLVNNADNYRIELFYTVLPSFPKENHL